MGLPTFFGVQSSLAWTLSFILYGVCLIDVTSSELPNILMVLVDDLGWNDVSYHGGCDFKTPNIDSLAEEALQLTNYYVQHYCTPTRSALMSGRYPMRDGLQQYVIRSMAAYGMPLDVQTLPEHLRTAGYSTHLLGFVHFDSIHLYDEPCIATTNDSENGISAFSIPTTRQITGDSTLSLDITATKKSTT